jgi:alpha-tubulin suppressor-like RCC1 family protein
MSERYPGGLIRKTPPTITGPATSGPLAGEGGSASGVWTLADVLAGEKADIWPKPVIPRQLYAWGLNDDGVLGDGTVVSRSSPVQIGALTDWADISTGARHVLSVKNDGTLWAWGYGNSGRLGNNSTDNRSSPIQVGALTNWSQASGGRYTSSAVKTDGTMWTWGRRDQGQLGNNESSVNGASINSPIQIGSDTNWQSVAMAGNGRHTLAVKTTGSLWSWGLNSNGGLGQNNTISRSSPVQVGALTNWSRVSGGGYHSVSVKTDSTLWAWGQNTDGQLGQGNVIARSSPVQIGALADWADVCASLSCCLAVKTNGTLWAWGQNTVGQLGLSDATNRSSPVQVGALTNWASVPRNGGGINGVNFGAVKADGTIWLWGSNLSGQLGQNNLTYRSSPVQVGALTNWNRLSTVSSSVVAITKG